MHRSLLVGCGSRGRRHADALARSDAFELCAVCDIEAERAEAVAEEHGVPAVHTDLGAALDAVAPEHVSAVFPPTVRLPVYRQVLDAAPASMVIEKPVANTRQEACRIADAAADTETTVTVSHQHIYTAEAAALRRWVASGRLGDPERVTATTRGYLLSNGTHLAHMLDWLLGERATRVRGFAEGPELMDARHTAEPEGALLAVEYPGTSAVLDAGEFAPGIEDEASRWLETRVDVVGTEGHAEMVLTDHAALRTPTDAERVDAEDAAGEWFGEGGWEKWEYLEGYATGELYADQARVLAGDLGEHPASIRRAMAAHRTVEAGLRAAVERRGVDPHTEPPALGTPTERRLRRRLYARRQQVVPTGLFGDTSLSVALGVLAEHGSHDVALDAAHAGADLAATLAEYRVDVPVVRVAATGDVARAAELAGQFGAETLVVGTDGVPVESSWLPAARDADCRVAVDPEEAVTGDALADIAASLEVGVAVSPAAVRAAGDDPVAALGRVGERAAVLYLRDAHPGVGDDAVAVEDGLDSAVPGGGSVDFRRLLAAAVESAPRAHWLHSLPTDGLAPGAVGDALDRAHRHVERCRP
jgi:predicted dehydrogenase/sugar phosphate isomerase/epimerase